VVFGKRLIVSHTPPKKTSESGKKLLKFWLPRQSIDRQAVLAAFGMPPNLGLLLRVSLTKGTRDIFRQRCGGETTATKGKSLPKKVTDGLAHDLAADVGNRLRQRNFLGANFDAILCVAALLNAAIAHQCRETFAL